MYSATALSSRSLGTMGYITWAKRGKIPRGPWKVLIWVLFESLSTLLLSQTKTPSLTKNDVAHSSCLPSPHIHPCTHSVRRTVLPTCREMVLLALSSHISVLLGIALPVTPTQVICLLICLSCQSRWTLTESVYVEHCAASLVR